MFAVDEIGKLYYGNIFVLIMLLSCIASHQNVNTYFMSLIIVNFTLINQNGRICDKLEN